MAWTDKAVGETDELINAYNINPTTLLRDDMEGTIMNPKHIHKALRRYLCIEDHPITKLFPFSNCEDFDFFVMNKNSKFFRVMLYTGLRIIKNEL